MKLLKVLLGLLCIIIISNVYALSVPSFIAYQGKILNQTSGLPVPNASLSINITAMGDLNNVVWGPYNYLNVTDSQGVFDLVLGANHTLNLTPSTQYQLVVCVDLDSSGFSSCDSIFGNNESVGGEAMVVSGSPPRDASELLMQNSQTTVQQLVSNAVQKSGDNMTGYLNISGMLNVSGNVSFRGINNCGSLSTDTNGFVICNASTGTGSDGLSNGSNNVNFTKLALGTATLPATDGSLNMSGNLTISGVDVRVGIGINKPNALLHVMKDDQELNLVRFGDSKVVNSTVVIHSNNSIFTPESQSPMGNSTLHLSSDITGVGQNVYGASLTFSRLGSEQTKSLGLVAVQSGSNVNDMGFAFFTNPTSTVVGPMNEAMRLTHVGNLGIGLINSGQRLEVNGNTNISGMLNVSGNVSLKALASCDVLATDADGFVICDVDGGGSVNGSIWNRTGTSIYQAILTDQVGIGTSVPNGSVHIVQASSGGATPHGAANGMVIESNTNTGISMLTPNSAVGNIYFGDPQLAYSGIIRYQHDADIMSLWANGAIKFNITPTSANVYSGTDFSVDINTLYVDSSGNKIGVGTITPTNTLDVVGTVNITQSTYLASSPSGDYRVGIGVANALGITTANATLEIYKSESITNPQPILTLSYRNGNGGSPQAAETNLSIISFRQAYSGNSLTNVGEIKLIAETAAWSPQTGFAFSPRGTSGNPKEVMRISGAGNVGIGTSSPTQKLEVINGNVNITSSDSSGKLYFSNTGTDTPTSTIQSIAWGESLVIAANLEYDGSGTPFQNMKYIEDAGTSTTGGIVLHLDANDKSLRISQAPTSTGAGTEATEVLIAEIEDDGIFFNQSVGIGTTTPTHPLTVVGNMNVSNSMDIGTGLFYGSISDHEIRFPYGNWTNATSGKLNLGHQVIFSGRLPSAINSYRVVFELNATAFTANNFNGNIHGWVHCVDDTGAVGMESSEFDIFAVKQSGAYQLAWSYKRTGETNQALYLRNISDVFTLEAPPCAYYGQTSYLIYSSLEIQAHLNFVKMGETRSGGSLVMPTNTYSLMTGNVGIGAYSPKSALHVNATTAFTNAWNSYTGLVIDSSSITAGTGSFGAGIDFIQLGGTANKKAAIVPIQVGGDNDMLGLAFFTSVSATGASPIVEQMRMYGGVVTLNGTLNATCTPGFQEFSMTSAKSSQYNITAQTTLDISGKRNYLLFNDSNDNFAEWTFLMPNTYCASQVMLCNIAFGSDSATSGNVVWNVSLMATSDEDAASLETDSFDNGNTLTIALPSSLGYHNLANITLSNKDNVAPNDMVTVLLRKMASNAADTALGNAKVSGFKCEWN